MSPRVEESLLRLHFFDRTLIHTSHSQLNRVDPDLTLKYLSIVRDHTVISFQISFPCSLNNTYVLSSLTNLVS